MGTNNLEKTCPAKIGGADGIRTHDLLDAIEARSQLRHGPTEGMPKVYHSGKEKEFCFHKQLA
jgi:hypothetical protein